MILKISNSSQTPKTNGLPEIKTDSNYTKITMLGLSGICLITATYLLLQKINRPQNSSDAIDILVQHNWRNSRKRDQSLP